MLPNSPNGLDLSQSEFNVSSPQKEPLEGTGNEHDESSSLRLWDGPTTPKESIKTPDSVNMTKLMKRESYKAQRKNYRREKKRVANELVSMLKDPSIIVLSDWLKVRGTLKGWTKLWSVLKPGLLLLYKSPKTHKSSHWVGTIILSSCELIERPSKKDGFCFKLFHPLEQSIWATKGPSGETIGAMIQPLPTAYLIFRAPSEADGKCWMDALELALRCSSLLIRSMSRDSKGNPQSPLPPDSAGLTSPLSKCDNIWNEADIEKHFHDPDLEDDVHTDNDPREVDGAYSLRSSDSDSDGECRADECNSQPVETPYMESGKEEFGIAGDAGQTEEVADENKSLIWALVKQVRPGMDLSKVVLPTFILEPRSFLDKLTDYHYHADILSKAVLEDDPFNRIKLVTQWYLSGFYKKPKGLKKPYNPILGEVFRCFWEHPDTGTRTFYIAEQVSHHPPVSAFYVTNRKDGFCISGSILAKSKFYGNSLSAILDGQAQLTLLTRGEDYCITMPYAHCKGILVGTMTLELGGKISIECEKTGYHTEIEFKLKPFLAGVESANGIVGKIKLGKETLATLEGHWDQEIFLIDRRTDESQLFWNPTAEIREKRLKRFTVPMDHQREYESERLWRHVASAIVHCDQVAATEEKTLLEEVQRQAVKERKAKREEWIPRYFQQDISGEWVYKHADSRPWDPRTDVLQFECDCIIKTKTRHRAPVVCGSSIMSLDETQDVQSLQRINRNQRLSKQGSLALRVSNKLISGSSSPEGDTLLGSDSSDSEDEKHSSIIREIVEQCLRPMEIKIQENTDRLSVIQRHLISATKRQNSFDHARSQREWLFLVLITLMHVVLYWLLAAT